MVDSRVPEETHRAVVTERDQLSAERDSLAKRVKALERDVEGASERTQQQLVKIEADRDRQVAALEHQRDELAQMRRISESKVEAEEHQAIVAERDELVGKVGALETELKERSSDADAAGRDANALAELTEKHTALQKAHQELTESFNALKGRADNAVDSKAHEEVVAQRDVLAEEQKVLLGEVERLRAIDEANRQDGDKLSALTDEHSRQMDAFEQLKRDFEDLQGSTREQVDVEQYTKVASERDALQRNRDELLDEISKLKSESSEQPGSSSALEEQYAQQVEAFKRLQADFDKYRRDTALERAAAKRAGIALGDFADEADAEELLARQEALMAPRPRRPRPIR